MPVLTSFVIAFSTFSKIPMPQVDWTPGNRRYMFCFFPLIGVCIGLALALWVWICERLSLNFFIKASIATAIPLLLTGGIHMDGLMDVCDALGAYKTKEERQAILKDSHVGSFAVLTCCLYLFMMAGFMSELWRHNILQVACGFISSRAVSAFLSVKLPKSHPGMLTQMTNVAAYKVVLFSSIFYESVCVLIWWVSSPIAAMLSIGSLGLSAWLICRRAFTLFDGFSGDLAGAFLQMAELLLIAIWCLWGRIA